MARVRLHNLTDVETPQLRAKKAVNTTVVVWTWLVSPGNSVEVEDSADIRQRAQPFVSDGMLSVGQPPAAYLKAKAAQKRG